MRIFILLFILLCSLWGAYIDEFAHESGYFRDYDEAIIVAKQEEKILMLVVVADFCPWCKKFERKTLKDSEISARIKKDFVPIVIDKHRDKEHYPKKFYSQMIPTIFFINPITGDTIYKSISYIKKRDFAYNMDEALRLFKENTND